MLLSALTRPTGEGKLYCSNGKNLGQNSLLACKDQVTQRVLLQEGAAQVQWLAYAITHLLEVTPYIAIWPFTIPNDPYIDVCTLHSAEIRQPRNNLAAEEKKAASQGNKQHTHSGLEVRTLAMVIAP